MKRSVSQAVTEARAQRPRFRRNLLFLLLALLSIITILSLSLGLSLGFGLQHVPPPSITDARRYGGSLNNTGLAILEHPRFASLLYAYAQHESGDILELVYSGGTWYGGNQNVTVLPAEGLDYVTADGDPRYVPGPRRGTPLAGVWYGDDLRSLFYVDVDDHVQEIYTPDPYNFQEAWRWTPRNDGGTPLLDLQLRASSAQSTALAACAHAVSDSASEVRLFYGADDGRAHQAGLRARGWEYLGPIYGGREIQVDSLALEPTAYGGLACTTTSVSSELTLYHYSVAADDGAKTAGRTLYLTQSTYSARTGDWNTALVAPIALSDAAERERGLGFAALTGTIAEEGNGTVDTVVYTLPVAPTSNGSANAGTWGTEVYFHELLRSGSSGVAVGAREGGGSTAVDVLSAALQEMSETSEISRAAETSELLGQGGPLRSDALSGTRIAAAWVEGEGGGERELLVLYRNGTEVVARVVGPDGSRRVERVPVMRTRLLGEGAFNTSTG